MTTVELYDHTVFLTGFSGCGKTTIGRELARLLGVVFVDTDELIRNHTGRSIADIFENDGESVFRRMERGVVDELSRNRQPRVIALGGGALLDRRTRERVRSHGRLVYLSCSLKELCRRLKGTSDRPLLRVHSAVGLTSHDGRVKRVRELLNERLPYYKKADLTLSTTARQPERAARELWAMLRKQRDRH